MEPKNDSSDKYASKNSIFHFSTVIYSPIRLNNTRTQ